MRAEGHAWHGGRILVCEDNLLLAEVVCDFLRDCGLQPIGPASRLEEGMRLGRERALDGAVLDINLNGRLCFPLCSVLSARRIPFIFLTGYSGLSADIIPLPFRAIPLVAKPFEPNELKEALAAMLGLDDGQSPPRVPQAPMQH
jgi:DNA-binding response OmpR family regulator